MSSPAEPSSGLVRGATAARPDDLVAIHVPIGPIDAGSLARRGASAVFDGADGPGGGAVVAGFGEAARLVGRGDARWDQLERAAARLFATIRGPAAADARLVGGAAFAPDPGQTEGEPWIDDGLGDAAFVLPRWTWIEDERGTRLLLIARADELGSTTLEAEARELFGTRLPGEVAPRAATTATSIDDGSAAFVVRVEAASAAIAAGALEKVVVGRRVELELDHPADVAAIWASLREREPGTMRLLWRDAGSALLAASPERLVVRDGERVVIDALAGTIARDGDDEAAIARLSASDKDRREHDVVVRSIARVIADLGGATEHHSSPHVRTLRAVHHLATIVDASFDIAPTALALARALHPTPAVAGTPRAAATAFLRAHEAARGWFTGAFGWFDGAGNGAFAVILRAMLLRGSRAHLFAGTGIVQGSEAALELAETEAKLRTARGALGLELAS